MARPFLRRTASAEFRRLWAEHDVAVRRADRETLRHPRVGRLFSVRVRGGPDRGPEPPPRTCDGHPA
ncbi:hypothetical protein OG943_10370 [Amycolatopsis sp. NBC_00345]